MHHCLIQCWMVYIIGKIRVYYVNSIIIRQSDEIKACRGLFEIKADEN